MRGIGWRLGLMAVPMSQLMAGAVYAMPAPMFLERATALIKRGPMAIFSSDLGLLKQEATIAGKALRAERLSLEAAHRPASYCPPPGASMMGPREMVAGIGAIPASLLQPMDVKDAMRHVLSQKYPCLH